MRSTHSNILQIFFLSKTINKTVANLLTFYFMIKYYPKNFVTDIPVPHTDFRSYQNLVTYIQPRDNKCLQPHSTTFLTFFNYLYGFFNCLHGFVQQTLLKLFNINFGLLRWNSHQFFDNKLNTCIQKCTCYTRLRHSQS
jgi:hypothetical protein